MAAYDVGSCRVNNLINHFLRVCRLIGYPSYHLNEPTIFDPGFNNGHDYFIEGVSDPKFLLNPLRVDTIAR